MSAKYPRTFHLPWSPGVSSDDKVLRQVAHLVGVELVLTEKLDGENSTFTSDPGGYHARSHFGMPSHASNTYGKALHGTVRGLIDPGLSVFFEYAAAVHSIRYDLGLVSYANVFGVRDDVTGVWWSWDDVVLMASVLGLPTVPVLWRGFCGSEREVQDLVESYCVGASSVYGSGAPFVTRPDGVTLGQREGAVVRVAGSFVDPMVSLGKWVRQGHVQTTTHWKTKGVEWQPLRPRT